MAPQAVQLVHVVLGETGTIPNLPGVAVELDAARRAIEVIWVVYLAAELQRLIVDHRTEKIREDEQK